MNMVMPALPSPKCSLIGGLSSLLLNVLAMVSIGFLVSCDSIDITSQTDPAMTYDTAINQLWLFNMKLLFFAKQLAEFHGHHITYSQKQQ